MAVPYAICFATEFVICPGEEQWNQCAIFDIDGCDKQAAFYNPEFASRYPEGVK